MQSRVLLDHAERILNRVLVCVVPEPLDHKNVLGQPVGERVEHGVARVQLPVRLELASQSEDRHQLSASPSHARHGGVNLVSVPGATSVDHRIHCVSVDPHGESRHRTAGADCHSRDDYVSATRPGEEILEGGPEGRVLVTVYDPCAPIDRLVGKDFLSSDSVSPFCHWAFEELSRTGISSALAILARPTTLAL